MMQIMTSFPVLASRKECSTDPVHARPVQLICAARQKVSWVHIDFIDFLRKFFHGWV
jgi:hypothetical protein